MGRVSEPRPCRDCDTQIVFAVRAGTRSWVPLEAVDRPPFSDEATGCLVVIGGQAWVPRDLIEDFQARAEISEASAREVVSGYPFHRPHHHRED